MTRVVWVSFDVVGRDCLLEAAAAGAEVVGVVTLPGRSTPTARASARSTRPPPELGARLIETPDVNDPPTVAAVRRWSPS